MSESQACINVEVAYADAHRQVVLPLSFSAAVTVAEVLSHAAQASAFDGLDISQMSCGIYGRLLSPQSLAAHVVKSGDRIELYRELEVDAKSARRQRALQQQRDKAGKEN